MKFLEELTKNHKRRQCSHFILSVSLFRDKFNYVYEKEQRQISKSKYKKISEPDLETFG